MTSHTETLYKAFLTNPEIVIDSRKVTPGCMFFGLEGAHVDGSAYAIQALETGAALAVAKTGSHPPGSGLVLTDNPLTELQELARYRRTQLQIPVLGITGSNGKTTTKELTQRVLSMRYRTTATSGNLNNHIGVPLTLLSIRDTDELAIIEMGANHIGEIAFLSSLAQPTHGVITNIGRAHLEGFGGVEGVVRAKTELYQFLADHDGIVFVNRDEPYLSDHVTRISKRVVYYEAETASWSPWEVGLVYRSAANGGSVEFMDEQGRRVTAETALFGSYNLKNIATAITIGLHFGIESDAICTAIAEYVPSNNRAQRLEKGSNVWILDAYNANPTSMIEALRSFAQFEHAHKGVILGAMMELGAYSDEAHDAVVQEAGKMILDELILIGEGFRIPARSHGYLWFERVQDLQDYWAGRPPAQMCYLVKGSRAMHLESVLDAFE